jgi:predicted acyl esterase
MRTKPPIHFISISFALLVSMGCDGSSSGPRGIGGTAGSGGSGGQPDTALPSEYPEEWGVLFREPRDLPFFYEFGRESFEYAEGEVFPRSEMPLPCDIVQDRDIPVTLRDGVVIYTDVLRAADSLDAELPAIVSWSPYGKTVPLVVLINVPGVPLDWFSRLGKFEGADAAFWACNGYAVVNPDARGVWGSEGRGYAFGRVEAGDGHDLIEWVATQDWSNGKVGLHGTSWLAISQWFIAATQPPHLTAIAPWSGLTDIYRDNVCIGGIPDTDFMSGFHMPGMGLQEDVLSTFNADPYMTPYWKDKSAELEKITIPAYVGTDNTTVLHRFGAYEGFRRISSEEKWFRVNNTQEWHDQYNRENEEDLLLFFDHYLKGIDNGWEDTPRVRMAVLDPGGEDQLNVPFDSWPLDGTEYTKVYLDAATDTLSPQPVEEASQVSYDAHTGEVQFTITFDEETQVIGYLKLRLWVEADGSDDMDLFVLVEKLDADGNLLDPRNEISKTYDEAPPGLPGRLRVSLRELDPNLSTDFMPVGKFEENDNLSPGQIVPVDIRIYPTAMVWHAGQQLRLSVAGHNIDRFDELNDVPTIYPVNEGNHVIHAGSEYESYLQLPIIPSDG